MKTRMDYLTDVMGDDAISILDYPVELLDQIPVEFDLWADGICPIAYYNLVSVLYQLTPTEVAWSYALLSSLMELSGKHTEKYGSTLFNETVDDSRSLNQAFSSISNSVESLAKAFAGMASAISAIQLDMVGTEPLLSILDELDELDDGEVKEYPFLDAFNDLLEPFGFSEAEILKPLADSLGITLDDRLTLNDFLESLTPENTFRLFLLQIAPSANFDYVYLRLSGVIRAENRMKRDAVWQMME